MNELIVFLLLLLVVLAIVGAIIFLEDREATRQLDATIARAKIDLSTEERELLRWGGEP